MKENQMTENMDEILQAVEKRLNKIGWKFFIKPHQMRNKHWHLEVQQEGDYDQGNNRHFTVTVDLSVCFEEKHKRHMGLNEMLDFIQDCLQPDKIA